MFFLLIVALIFKDIRGYVCVQVTPEKMFEPCGASHTPFFFSITIQVALWIHRFGAEDAES